MFAKLLIFNHSAKKEWQKNRHCHSFNVFLALLYTCSTGAHFFTLSGCWAMKDFQDLAPLVLKGLLRS